MTTMTGPTAGRRRAVSTSSVDWVRPVDGTPGCVEVRPAHDRVHLAEWARAHPDRVRAWLAVSGAVLFRGFGVSLPVFRPVMQSLAGDPAAYLERSSPRTELADRIYTATDHPADQPIVLHNENSYQASFPASLAFCCLTPAARGGATLLADSRRVLARIDSTIVRTFVNRGVMYVRNYGLGVGLSWQESFQTGHRGRVHAYCRDLGISCDWRSESHLRTRNVRPVLLSHPHTGERVWFNHTVFFHVSSLLPQVRAALRAQFADADLPNNTYYGDGGVIEPEVMDHLRAAYAAEEHAIAWQAGDVLLVDNLLAAHGRAPFAGERKVVVAMAGSHSWAEAAVAGAPK